ncbi:hypothetical protein ACGFNU_47165 [Spirillospora sp. NPDC048911]|uniref:hypothetical protein n=1 Tax=Spirillospora sp. NPDC048911 TaxID=3364527 RepID=UPI00371EBD54
MQEKAGDGSWPFTRRTFRSRGELSIRPSNRSFIGPTVIDASMSGTRPSPRPFNAGPHRRNIHADG